MIGQTLQNRYRLDAELGRGGMGVVYRAQDTVLNRSVAVKLLRPFALGEEGRLRLLHEAQAVAQLDHPNIVNVYDAGETDLGPFLVMQLIDGQSLRAHPPQSMAEILSIALQVCAALEHAHQHGVIHRDLKPENIMLTQSGVAKLMDFGLARSGASRLTVEGTMLGTVYYLSPEQAQGLEVDERTDLYALGVMLYELAAGRLPYGGDDPIAVIAAHLYSPLTPARTYNPNIPPQLDALISRLMSKSPKDRPASASEVRQTLERLATPSPASESASLALTRRGALVGRGDAQRQLTERLAALQSGSGGVVLLSGEPGIGKTRLLEEIIAQARARNYQVLVGRCQERNTGIPYLPLSDALENFARGCEPARWTQYLTAAGDGLAILLSDRLSMHSSNRSADTIALPDLSNLVRDSRGFRPVRALRDLFDALAQTAPVLWVMDDLHWADPLTLELLHDVAAQCREAPLLILGAYREVELERTHPFSRLLVDLHHERLLTRVRLKRLTASDTHKMLADLLDGAPPSGLAELVHEQTEGNPFFIEELSNSLVEESQLVKADNAPGYTLAPHLTISELTGRVPQGVRAAIGARLDRLEPETQQTLALASVIGRAFALDVLSRLAGAHGLSQEAIEQALQQAQAAHFINERESVAAQRAEVPGFLAGAPALAADYEFDHALIHQVVYGELDRPRRRRLHGEIGRLLEEVYHGRESMYAEQLAYHFIESDDDAKAQHYSLAAGNKMYWAYYDADLALGYYLPALDMAISKEPALRHLSAHSPAPKRGARHRFTSEELDAVIDYLGEVLAAVGHTPAAKTVALLANRICTVALHSGEVFDASIRLYEQQLLGPNVQKLVVETERGKLVGILEMPEGDGPFVVVMLFHGSPGSKETGAGATEAYLTRGMATLRVDLPGHGETTVPTTLGVADGEILRRMVDRVLAHERVDKRGIGIVGWSYGPWAAVHLAARDERIRALAAISGQYDIKDDPLPTWRAFRIARWEIGMWPHPDTPLPPDHDAAAVAHLIRCPVLLVYGALEPAYYGKENERLAPLIPQVRKVAWRSAVHALVNAPEAAEYVADWMKAQLGD